MKWAVYDSFTVITELFATEGEARDYYNKVLKEIDEEAETFETVYLMEIVEKKNVD